MKKSLLFLSLSAMALSLFAFGGKKSVDNNYFVDCGYDALNENNQKVERLYAINASEDKKGANKDAGNTASEVSSKLGVQYGTNSKGHTCMRFAVAINSLSSEVVFNRTLTLTNGTVDYATVTAKTAYESISGCGETIYASDWNNQFEGADYKFFAIYTLAGIPESEYGAKIEVSATVTPIVKEEGQEGDPEVSEPVANAAPKEAAPVEVYNSANIYGLSGKAPEGVKPVSDVKTDENGKLVAGQVITDPVTRTEYTVKDDGTLSASSGKVSATSSSELVVSSVYVQIGNELVEVKVSEIGDSFTDGLKHQTSIVKLPVSIKIIKDTAFEGINGVTTFKYEGTKDQWNQIKFGSNLFHNNVKTVIIECSDGTYSVSASNLIIK